MAKDVSGPIWVFDAATQAEGFANKDSYLLWSTFTTTFAADTLTITAHGLSTGDGPVQVSTSAADLPSGLTALTDYWVIKVDADTLQLATSEANALAGTAVALADDGTGTHSLNMKSVFPCHIYIKRIKVDTGAGGNVLINESSGGRMVLKGDSTPANDTLEWPIGTRVRGIYITTLPAGGQIHVIHGNSAEGN